ncbi:hypothetical protein OIU84_004132 [Salix udensis]|uniref:Uncharacterized protein n=1 Tax=Salix udensis TaxID=889485 RepID=A0AAD6K2H5_9ROSI|nr:hypothetical protein OIU84_004132 [Salix udensis]
MNGHQCYCVSDFRKSWHLLEFQGGTGVHVLHFACVWNINARGMLQ